MFEPNDRSLFKDNNKEHNSMREGKRESRHFMHAACRAIGNLVCLSF